MLYGLAFPARRAAVVRFEGHGEAGGSAVPLRQIAQACLDLAESDVVGLIIAGEAEGLVGAALRRSPATLPDGVDPFAPPRRSRLALAHPRARAPRVHGPGRRRGHPREEPGTPAVRPPCLERLRAGAARSLSRGGRPVPATPRRSDRARRRPSRTCSSPAGSTRSST